MKQNVNKWMNQKKEKTVIHFFVYLIHFIWGKKMSSCHYHNHNHNHHDHHSWMNYDNNNNNLESTSRSRFQINHLIIRCAMNNRFFLLFFWITYVEREKRKIFPEKKSLINPWFMVHLFDDTWYQWRRIQFNTNLIAIEAIVGKKKSNWIQCVIDTDLNGIQES